MAERGMIVLDAAVPGEGMWEGVRCRILVWLPAGLIWPTMMIGFVPANMDARASDGIDLLFGRRRSSHLVYARL